MTQDNTPTEKKLDDLYDLIDGIKVAMLTTRRPDGRLVSRPMQTQQRDKDADLWFVTSDETHKLDELEDDPHVNVAFYNNDSREWVSVSGAARLSKDRKKIHDLYSADWRAWFEDKGGAQNGGPDDPRITLIMVDADSVIYMKSDQSKPQVLFEIVKGTVTGNRPDVGDVRHVDKGELESGRRHH